MSIIGLGVDILKVERIKKIVLKYKLKFLKRILSPYEKYLYCSQKNRIKFLAKRFSAKESFFKALGIGIRNELKFQDVELKNDELGKPVFIFFNKTKKFLNFLKIKNVHVSISDENKYVYTIVILEN